MAEESGNSYSTMFRQYDVRLGRWMSPDPVFQPWQSPYNGFDGNPVSLTDPLGLVVGAGQLFDMMLPPDEGASIGSVETNNPGPDGGSAVVGPEKTETSGAGNGSAGNYQEPTPGSFTPVETSIPDGANLNEGQDFPENIAADGPADLDRVYWWPQAYEGPHADKEEGWYDFLSIDIMTRETNEYMDENPNSDVFKLERKYEIQELDGRDRNWIAVPTSMSKSHPTAGGPPRMVGGAVRLGEFVTELNPRIVGTKVTVSGTVALAYFGTNNFVWATRVWLYDSEGNLIEEKFLSTYLDHSWGQEYLVPTGWLGQASFDLANPNDIRSQNYYIETSTLVYLGNHTVGYNGFINEGKNSFEVNLVPES